MKLFRGLAHKAASLFSWARGGDHEDIQTRRSDALEDAFSIARFVTVRGTRIAYRQAGSGTPLVLLHGFRGSGRYWQRYVLGLAQHFQVIAPDLKGFGDSAKPRRGYSLSEHALTIKALLDALGIRRAILGGYSLGGVVALKIAALFPDLPEKLVLVATPLTSTQRENVAEVLNAPFWMRWIVQYPRASRLLLGVRSRWLVRLTVDVRHMPRAVIEDATKYRWNALADTFRSCIVTENMRQAARRLAGPALLIWGDRDNLVDIHHAHDLQAFIPDAALTVVPGAGHAILLTHVEDCLQAMQRFLTLSGGPLVTGALSDAPARG